LSKSQITEFFESLKNTVTNYAYHKKLIINIDETFLCPKANKMKVYTQKSKAIAQVKIVADEHTSLMFAIRASGDYMRPLVIFPLKTYPPLSPEVEESFTIVGSESGWITDEIFYNWITGDFIEQINEIRTKVPADQQRVLLISDNHGSRYVRRTIDFLIANNIDLVTIPPHSSTVLQPLDLTCNAEFKRILTNNYNPILNLNAPDRRMYLMDLTLKVLPMALSALNIENGYKCSGIIPFNFEQPLKSALVINDEEYNKRFGKNT